MEHVYRDGTRQGRVGRARHRFCESIENITNLSKLRDVSPEDLRRTVALMRVWMRTRPGHGFCEGYSGLGTSSTFGRDAPNAGDCVEASVFKTGVRHRLPALLRVHRVNSKIEVHPKAFGVAEEEE